MRAIFSVSLLAALVGLPCPSIPAQSAGTGGAATKENLDLPYDAFGQSDEEEEAPEIIVFYGQQYECDSVVFCVDKSSSMEGMKWKRCQQEILKNVTQFSEKTQFGIVLFDANVTKFPGSGRPADASPAMKAAAVSYISASTTGHGTCCKAGLQMALNISNQTTAKRKVILYLSDGRQTCPNAGDEAAYGAATLAEVTARNTQKAHINTLCIAPAGGDCDENFMKKLAAQNQGQYARIVQ